MLRLSTTYPQKRTLISGAASGIGEAFSVRLAADGWTVALCDVNAARLEDAAARVEGAGGAPITYCFDVRDRDGYQHAIGDFVQQKGGIDLLINNAGIGAGGVFEDVSLEDWDTTIDINLKGVIHGLHFALPHLKAQRSGHILNTASVAAFAAPVAMAPYNATKAAILAISETLYTELHDFNIRVSCMMPYFVRTNIHQGTIGTPEAKSAAAAMVTHSPYSADDLVTYALDQAGRGELYILFPAITRRLWRTKRFFPRRFFKMALDYARQMEQYRR